MNRKKIAVIFMVIVSICWAPTFSVTKNLFDSVGANSLTCIRFLVGTIIALVAKKILKNDEKIKKEDYKILGCTIIFCSGHYILSNLASTILDISESIVFSSFQALITLIVASLLLNKVIKPNVCFCVGIASVGAVLTMRIDALYSGAIIGYTYMFTATVSWSIYCVLMSKLLKKYRITTLVYYQLLFTFIITSPSLLLEQHHFSRLQLVDIAFLLFISIVCVVVCFWFNAFSLKNIGTISTGIFMNIGPILFTLANIKTFKIDITVFVGIIMIIIGIILTLYTMFKKS